MNISTEKEYNEAFKKIDALIAEDLKVVKLNEKSSWKWPKRFRTTNKNIIQFPSLSIFPAYRN